jgi:hypothetical protein
MIGNVTLMSKAAESSTRYYNSREQAHNEFVVLWPLTLAILQMQG